MSDTITIGNNGQQITDTNYWNHDYCKKGYFFLSWNAGACRLLVPDDQKNNITEMETGKEIIISRGLLNGKESYEILFEDFSDSPFSIHVGTDQSDRLIPFIKGKFTFSIWTKEGKVKSFKARYRIVEKLPCLKAWGE